MPKKKKWFYFCTRNDGPSPAESCLRWFEEKRPEKEGPPTKCRSCRKELENTPLEQEPETWAPLTP